MLLVASAEMLRLKYTGPLYRTHLLKTHAKLRLPRAVGGGAGAATNVIYAVRRVASRVLRAARRAVRGVPTRGLPSAVRSGTGRHKTPSSGPTALRSELRGTDTITTVPRGGRRAAPLATSRFTTSRTSRFSTRLCDVVGPSSLISTPPFDPLFR